MAKIKHIPQLIQTECGLCCIVMLSRYYGNYIEINDLRDHLNPGRDGISISILCDILEWQKFECKTYKGTADMLKTLKAPAIVYWENQHFAILEKVKGNTYYVVDPALGNVKYNKKEFEEGFSNLFVCALPGKDFVKHKAGRSIWFEYLKYLKNSKILLVGIFGLSVLSYLFTIIFNIFIQNMIDSIGNFNYKITWIAMGTIMAYVLIVLLNSLTKVFFNTRLFSDFSKEVYHHLTKVDYVYFEMRSYGNLAFSLESISMVKNLYAEKMVNFLVSLGAVAILFLYLSSYSVVIVLMILIIMLVIGFILRFMSNRVLMLNQLEISGLTKLQEIQTEFIYSILNIKIAGIEDKIYNQWERQFDYTNEKTRKRDIYQSYYSTAGVLVQTILPIIILFILITNINLFHLTIGQIVAAYSVITLISSYMVNIFTTMNFFALSEQYLQRVSDITNQKVEENGTRHIGDITSIELKNVSFRYNDRSSYILENVSLEIKEGEKIAFVGQSGSGKSTMAKIILGLYHPVKGQVRYNNMDLKEIDIKYIKKQCGMVPQDNTLFNKTILENITMGRSDISLEQVEEACKMAEVSDEINRMPMKYHTIISDMGMNISGGQRQRIILARALVTKPRVLIFDEATSSLDSANERLIYDNVYSRKCTRIIIAHRLSTIIDADCIYVLKDGGIVERGTHEELIRKNGEYSRLYSNSIY